MDTLNTGQRFPGMEARSADDITVRLPDAGEGHASVLIFYRGFW
ncbi:MAG: hypothetical protein ABI141_14070 [Gemmatimonadaceae bacterium]